MVMKIILALGFAAHVLCALTDCMLGFTRKGRIDVKSSLKDSEKMREEFAEYSPNCALASMLLGVAAIATFSFGYIGLCKWMDGFSHVCAVIMYISGLAMISIMTAHHVFCGTVFWFYVRMGRTDEAREASLDFFKKTIPTMYGGYLSLAVYLITFFIAVLTAKTSLPAWACIFNAAPLLLLLAPTKLPAKGNIASAVMFLGCF